MTTQLTIKTLSAIRDVCKADHMETEAEALDMAIKALEQPEIIRCKDCEKAPKCYGDVVMRSKGGGNIYCPLTYCSEAERRTDG